MRNKTALIFGISGQDGAYLADFLLNKNYRVFGVTRKKTSKNLFRLKKLKIIDKVKTFNASEINLKLLNKISKNVRNLDEIYYLSGETSPLNSINKPLQTFKSNVNDLIFILEFLRTSKNRTKLFYASSSEIYKKNKKKIFNEQSEISPTTPYGISKAAGLWLIKFYRKYYDLYCCTGILFNHESPLRSGKFVFKKIIDESKKIKKKGGKIYLGNIYVKRDIGWAPDYVKAMWKMLQLKKPLDIVIGSGNIYSIKNFLNLTFKYLKLNKNNVITNKKEFIRKIDNNEYRSNPTLAKKKINLKNSIDLEQIIIKMLNNEHY
jgi:GDPmannose 4,6-dehydratase